MPALRQDMPRPFIPSACAAANSRAFPPHQGCWSKRYPSLSSRVRRNSGPSLTQWSRERPPWVGGQREASHTMSRPAEPQVAELGGPGSALAAVTRYTGVETQGYIGIGSASNDAWITPTG